MRAGGLPSPVSDVLGAWQVTIQRHHIPTARATTSTKNIPEVFTFCPTLFPAATGLVEGLRRASVDPIYHGFKGYLCCTASTSGHWMYVSWTVAGSIALAFCIVVSTTRWALQVGLCFSGSLGSGALLASCIACRARPRPCRPL